MSHKLLWDGGGQTAIEAEYDDPYHASTLVHFDRQTITN